jgi:F-type H+-transporting ATPase subunit b
VIARICLLLLCWVVAGAAVLAADPPGHNGHDHEHIGHAGGVNAEPQEFRQDLAIYTFFVFVCLLLVLWKFAWEPISAGLDQREQRIAANIAAAEKLHADAQALTRQYEEKLAASADEVRKIIEEARRDGEHTMQELIDKGQQEVQTLRDRTMREIETARSQALKDLAERSIEAALDVAGKLVHAHLKPEDHRQLIDDALDRFSAASKN